MITERYKGGEIRVEARSSYDPLQEIIDSVRPQKGDFVTFTGDEETFFRS